VIKQAYERIVKHIEHLQEMGIDRTREPTRPSSAGGDMDTPAKPRRRVPSPPPRGGRGGSGDGGRKSGGKEKEKAREKKKKDRRPPPPRPRSASTASELNAEDAERYTRIPAVTSLSNPSG